MQLGVCAVKPAACVGGCDAVASGNGAVQGLFALRCCPC